MNFNKNKYINETIDTYLTTWSHLLNSEDFVKPKFLHKIDKYIFKNLTKKFKEIEIYYLLSLKDSGVKLGFFDKLKVWFSGVEPIYRAEQKEQKRLEREKAKKKKELKNKKRRKKKS